MGLKIDKAATQPLLDLFLDVQALEELKWAMRKAEAMDMIVVMRELDGDGQIIRLTGQGKMAAEMLRKT